MRLMNFCLCVLIFGYGYGQTPTKSSGLNVYQSNDYLNHNSASFKTPKIASGRGEITNAKASGLKAVLIVGPVVSDKDATTLEYVNDLKFAAQVLRENGVEVKEFYTPNNKWSDITKAAEGAHFLIYKGHGVYDGSTPPKWVGGFCLKNAFPSSEDIIKDLKLAPNGLVLISGCFTAGNAGSDIGKIDIKEAKRRIEMYSKPFFAINSSCYYANWYPSAFHDFLEKLFNGETLEEAYRSYPNGNNPAKINDFSYVYDSKLKLYIGQESYGTATAFNNAFIGDGSKKLADLLPIKK